MTLNEYIEKLQELKTQYGGDLPLVYSSDSEGNSFEEVYFAPQAGNFEDREWRSQETFEDEDCEVPEENRVVNAICIN